MAVIARRSVLAAGLAAAAATLATAMLLRKPSGPEVARLAPDASAVRLQGMAALRPVDPPRALPAISFLDDAGASRSLRDYAGKTVLLNLWATWCAPCVAEMPALAALARDGAAQDIVVLPLSSDAGGAEAVRKFFAAHGITGLPVLLDPKGAAGEALGIRGLPTTLLIDAQGRERARLEGAADWAAPDAAAKLLALAR